MKYHKVKKKTVKFLSCVSFSAKEILSINPKRLQTMQTPCMLMYMYTGEKGCLSTQTPLYLNLSSSKDEKFMNTK